MPEGFKSPRIIIGVPGVLRSVSGTKLIQTTIQKLIDGMNEEQRKYFKIVVVNAERDLFRGSANFNSRAIVDVDVLASKIANMQLRAVK
jgi:hypothetical protein